MHNRRAKNYTLTPKGRRQLDSDVEAWRALTTAVGHVLDADDLNGVMRGTANRHRPSDRARILREHVRPESR